MDRLLSVASALALAAPLAVQAGDVTHMESPELCVLYGVTLITGQPSYSASQSEIVAELERRVESCAPADVYMAAARERVRRLEAADEIVRQAESRDSLRREERNARIRAAGRAWLQLQEQNRPKTTRCTTFADTMTCTEN